MPTQQSEVLTAHHSSPSTTLWTVIIAAATIAALAMGLRQALGLYLKPISMELGLGREAFALAIALTNLVWGFAAPVTGYVADRFGAGRVVVLGCLALAAGFSMLYTATNDVQLLWAGILLGVGISGAGITALVGVAVRASPPQQRTEAISWIGIGSGIGILVALPYAHVLMEQVGWQQSLLVLAATALIALPLAYIVRGKIGHTSETINVFGEASREDDETLGTILPRVARTPSYWLLMAGFFVCGFHVVFYATHLPAYVADQGLPQWVAVAALTLVGLGNLIGTWLAGKWGSHFPMRHGLALIYFSRAGVFLGFLFLPINTTTILVLSALLGLLWLSTIPLTSGLVGVFFGAKWLTTLYGIVFLSHQLGSFSGVWLAGRLYDQTQSYDMMWWISVALGLVAAFLHLPIRETYVGLSAKA